ncbi:hypothetical protein EW146_g1341 [Bondarzewia mesenterica]|uniref:Transmembrane protein n=1 Tax=Bondarzewia mesenterica TaxID=1095465 RepID=A0A4S4MAC4_9AGAM|nr:hypothetical protein EW146_g1341 [Bondarzewia mesenterica]
MSLSRLAARKARRLSGSFPRKPDGNASALSALLASPANGPPCTVSNTGAQFASLSRAYGRASGSTALGISEHERSRSRSLSMFIKHDSTVENMLRARDIPSEVLSLGKYKALSYSTPPDPCPGNRLFSTRPRSGAISGGRPSVFALGLWTQPSVSINPPPATTFNVVTSTPSAAPTCPESPLARARRTASPSSVPDPQHHTTETSHTVSISLPRPGGRQFSPEMITISVLKGDRVRIVADAWELERDCRFEWNLAFSPRTVNMASMRAQIDAINGVLVLDMRRIGYTDLEWTHTHRRSAIQCALTPNSPQLLNSEAGSYAHGAKVLYIPGAISATILRFILLFARDVKSEGKKGEDRALFGTVGPLFIWSVLVFNVGQIPFDLFPFVALTKALRTHASTHNTLSSRIATILSNMIPLIPTLALAVFSLICSSFVILRIIIPILPPHPWSKRVRPSEFGLPNFRPMSAADKSHVWLALCDVLALAIFVWEAISETLGGAWGLQSASDPGSSARLWFALTLRQTCLLVVSSMTLLHVRMGRSVSFGANQWVLWAPVALLAITSTTLAGVLAGAGVNTFFVGYLAYSTLIVVLSTAAFVSLVVTLVIIKRNLNALNEASDPWPPVREVEDKPRPSFGTEDVDALRDGSSWITSRASSQHESISAFSFSTHHTQRQNPAAASNPSIPAKSSYWFNPSSHDIHAQAQDYIPPVPPVPSAYKTKVQTYSALGADHDPFRRMRMDSQSSWLSSSEGSRPTMSAWSFPTTIRDPHMMAAVASTQDLNAELLPADRPETPAMSSAQVLGGYGYSPSPDSEKGIAALAAAPSNDIDVSVTRIIGWLAGIWVPYALVLPYFFSVSLSSGSSPVMPILLVISVTISSPILALNILLRSPILIPTGLFDMHGRSPSSQSTLPPVSREYKRSASTTVIDGRRSTDVWVAKGDAVDGKSRVGRAIAMLAPAPKLSVLPPEGNDVEPVTPPLPIQEDNSPPPTVIMTPYSVNSSEFGRTRNQSRTSSYFSNTDASLALTTKIMIAQRHYSAVATTVVLPPSPEKGVFTSGLATDVTTGVALGVSSARELMQSTHMRARSTSSISDPRSPISPPPSSPLPPTPPSIKLVNNLTHRKSYSSGFDFGAVNDDMNDIDALSAGLLPILVPGLKIGNDMHVNDDTPIRSPPGTLSKERKSRKKARPSILKGPDGGTPDSGGFTMSAEFSSPEVHSTPINRRAPRAGKTSAHKTSHCSLSSLSPGKDGMHSLSICGTEANAALETKVREYDAKASSVDDRSWTVLGSDFASNTEVKPESKYSQPAQDTGGPSVVRFPSSLTLRPLSPFDKPEDPLMEVDTARSSLATLIAALEHPMQPLPSANSEVTLFDFDADSGPLAESTPPDHRRNNATSQGRLSSITYIKSDNANAALKDESASPSTLKSATPSGGLIEWSARAVRPLVPKADKIQPKTPKASGPPSPRRGGCGRFPSCGTAT